MMDYFDIARFWSKVQVGALSECWIPTPTANYPDFKVAGSTVAFHRVAYQLAYGDIPEGAVIRHTCDNPRCCNPAHLVTGTHADNVRDRVLRQRSAIGGANGRSKLTADDVVHIRAAAGIERPTTLAKLYGVDRKVIHDVQTRVTWRHVP